MNNNETTGTVGQHDPDVEPTVAMTPIPDSMPESIPPEITPAADDDPVKKPRPKWLIPSIAAGCAIVLTVGGVAVWRAVDARHRLEAAKASCEAGLSTVNAAKTAWERKLKDGSVTTASKVTKDKVADAKTVATLADLTGTEYAKVLACEASDPTGYQKITDSNAKLQASYEGNASKLSKAVKAVNDSMTAKTLKDAKDALAKSVDAAKNLLKDSENRVADDKTREALTAAINDASKDIKDAKTATDLKSKLDAAVKTVNDSMTAKTKADEEAKAQAEAAAAAAAAQAQAQAQANSGNSGYSGYSSQGNGNSGYNYRKTQNNGGSTSNSGKSNGGSSSTGNNAGQSSNNKQWYECNAAGNECWGNYAPDPDGDGWADFAGGDHSFNF